VTTGDPERKEPADLPEDARAGAIAPGVVDTLAKHAWLTIFSSPRQAVRNLYNRLTRPRNSLVGRLIRLASAWFIFSLVITGASLTAYFGYTAEQRFQIGVGQMADTLLVDTDLAPDGTVLPPTNLDPRANRIPSGVYWQVSESDAKGLLTVRANSKSLYNAHLTLPVSVFKSSRLHPTRTIYFDSIGPKREPLRVAAVYSPIDHREFFGIGAWITWGHIFTGALWFAPAFRPDG